jgi:hypothetical protein
MPRNASTLLRPALVAALALTSALLPAPAAQARDLVRETAALALAQTQDETPPPTRSQVLADKQREQTLQAEAEKKKLVADVPYYKKWWFWALSAAVVGGTVALGIWAIDPSVPPARACSIGVIGCFGDGRSGAR